MTFSNLKKEKYHKRGMVFWRGVLMGVGYLIIIVLLFSMNDIEQIIKKLVEFNNERDWDQFHNPKDLAVAINVEAGELLELFLWKNPEDADKEKVKKELADIFAFAFLLANKYNLDVREIIQEKIEENGRKYPIEKAKGSAKKYNEL